MKNGKIISACRPPPYEVMFHHLCTLLNAEMPPIKKSIAKSLSFSNAKNFFKIAVLKGVIQKIPKAL